MRLWHQSFTVLQKLGPYNDALQAHFRKVARPDTEIVLHGMHEETYRTNYPGQDIRYAALMNMHGQQFITQGLKAEAEGFDGYMVMTLPEPHLEDVRTILDIPVVGYGESAMLTAMMMGERIAVLVFIPEIGPRIVRNAARIGISGRFAGCFPAGFAFNDVLGAFGNPGEVIEKFRASARKVIAEQGVEAIIPGEAPLCVLLATNGVTDVDGVPIVDPLAATIKMAESLVDLRRSIGLKPHRTGHYGEKPPRDRLLEVQDFYGIGKLR
ncbi:MAG: aspartate/glutamate racemase family protein [Flavobacteriaceae bacterium]